MDADEATRRIRQLLVSGDNILKNRDDDVRFVRARRHFEEAARVASEHGLADGVGAIIAMRLDGLADLGRSSSPP